MKNIDWKIISKVFTSVILLVFIISTVIGAYYIGYWHGVFEASGSYENLLSGLTRKDDERASSISYKTPSPLPKATPKIERVYDTKVDWSGPDLWQVVNDERVKHGVNPLKQADELCTIASIRLNELLELGKLDGHEGFSNMPERRPDLKWIFEKYSISEFLVAGASSAQEAVDLWLDTLGHKKLLTGGEYVVGCTYAQESFGVAIAAY